MSVFFFSLKTHVSVTVRSIPLPWPSRCWAACVPDGAVPGAVRRPVQTLPATGRPRQRQQQAFPHLRLTAESDSMPWGVGGFHSSRCLGACGTHCTLACALSVRGRTTWDFLVCVRERYLWTNELPWPTYATALMRNSEDVKRFTLLFWFCSFRCCTSCIA